MSRERDSQRSKAYAAERDAFKGNTEFTTVAECQAYLDKVTSSAWFKRHYGADYAITIQSGAGYRRAISYGGRHGRIQLPKWARKRWVIIHELAHNVTTSKWGHQVAGHGWQWAGIYLALVTHCLGKEDGDRLKAAFRAHKVRFTQPRSRKPLSPEQAAIQAERLAAARAVRLEKPRLLWEQSVKDPKGWKGTRDTTTVWWTVFEDKADGTVEEIIHRQETYWVGSARKAAKALIEKHAKAQPTSTFRAVLTGEVQIVTREYEPGYGYVTRYVQHQPAEEWTGRWSVGEVVAPQESLGVPCPA